MPEYKYSVHIYGNGSTGYARDYVALNTLAEVEREVKGFGVGLSARSDSENPGVWADVYPYNENDSVDETHGDYPLKRFILGQRGGVREVTV